MTTALSERSEMSPQRTFGKSFSGVCGESYAQIGNDSKKDSISKTLAVKSSPGSNGHVSLLYVSGP